MSATTDGGTRRGDWIQTATGHKFWPLDPRPGDVDVRDVAHALSNLCRFTGHAREFYSVAQHSVLASRIVPPASALAALLHDAAEAYMGDVARPWKRFLYVRTGPVADRDYTRLRDVEHTLLDVILAALGGPPRSDAAAWGPVAVADEVLLVTEARDLMAPLADGWRHTEANGFAALPDRIWPQRPHDARLDFLARYVELTGRTPADIYATKGGGA
ncbi:MAG: hypothetical protein K2P78_05075 [Gemmataceae bacterium]|nr:hypothetical protein [Gemmataceae bacterium]